MLMSGLPTLRSAVMAWASLTKVWIVGKRQQDYETKESYEQKNVAIFRVPISQTLEMKREGQRKWRVETIYTDNVLNLKVDDIIIFDDMCSDRFRILDKVDWSKYGYYEYQITSDYK